MRQGDDAGAAHQSERGFDADDAVRRRWANNGAIGFCADCKRAEVSRSRRTRSRARAARVAIEGVGVAREPAAAAPTAGAMAGTSVCPFAQILLAPDYCAALTSAP